MAWPPSPSSSFLITSTTIQWGTDELVSTYIVKSMRATDTNEVIYIENGTGLRAVRVQLWQGREWEITLVAETNFNDPTPGSTLTFTDPLSSTVITATPVISNSFNASRKQEGERVITAVFDTLIEGGGTPPPT